MQSTPANIKVAAATIHQFPPATAIIRISELSANFRHVRSKHLKDDPTFPRPVPLSNSKSRGSPVGFVLAEVQEWVRQRVALRV